jgi:hypothetical protein
MPSIGYILGDGAFDATVKSLKTGHGLGPIGSIGGGLIKSAGTLAMGGAWATGKGAMAGAEFVGKGLVNSFKVNPLAVIGSALTGAAIGHVTADLDGQANTGKTAAKGALFATGAAALGGAGLVSGFGTAVAGAGMMGVNAIGTIGSSFLRVKTKGEKAAEIEKNFRNDSANLKLSGEKYTEKLNAEYAKAGAEVGSAEEMNVGLGNLNDFKLRKGFAVPMIVGSSLVKGIAGGVRAFEKSRMGVNDGMIRTATPTIPVMQTTSNNSRSSYSNNAGATGDLVFALHKNR